MRANPSGFHTSLDDRVKEHILANIEGNYVIGQIARMSKIPRETLRRWLRRGEEEAINGVCSVFSQLWVEVEQKRGNEIKCMLEDVRGRKTNWQAIWELLKTVARDDFGMESVEIKELSAKVEQLSNLVDSFIEKSSQGVIDHGREMDSKSD